MPEEKDWDGVQERRENPTCFLHHSAINDMKQSIVDLEKDNKSMSRFQAQVRLAGFISLTLIASAYIYPTILFSNLSTKLVTINEAYQSEDNAHKREAREEYQNIHNKIDKNKDEIFVVKGDYRELVTEVKHLVGEVGQTNERLSQLVKILSEKDQIQKVYLENYREEK